MALGQQRLLNRFFPKLRSLFRSSHTDGVAWYFSSSIISNSYAATVIRTHVSTVELHQTGTFRTFYQLSYTAAAWFLIS